MRVKTHGFTLLETLIAFAIGSMVIIAGFTVVAQISSRQARLLDRLDLSRFARATLVEYVVTFPKLARTGTYAEKWKWEISETKLPKENLQSVGVLNEYIKVDITVSYVGQVSLEPLTLSTVSVRRGIGG